MADQDSADGRGASPVEYLTYAAGAIAASWGLMEILLSVDPFTMTYFKFGGWLALVAAALGLALAAGLGRGLWAAMLGGLVALGLGVLGLAPEVLGLAEPAALGLGGSLARMETFLAADRAGWSADHALLLFGAVLLSAAALVSARRAWVRRTLTAPMVVALFAVSFFAGVLSTGRAADIDRRDIALEELRSAGMGYTLSGVQNALFFLNDRGLKLYRDAGFEIDDIFLALGRASDDFSQGAPLLFEMIDRVEGAEVGPGGDVDQARRFERLILEAYARDAAAGVDAPFALFEPGADGRLTPRAGGPRALASYAAERGAETVLAVLAEAGGARLDGADAPSAGPIALTRAEGLGLRLDALQPAQAHLYAVLDPLAALAVARGAAGRPFDADQDARALCVIARARAEAGARPHPFLDDLMDRLDCGAPIAWPDAPAETAPLLDGAERSGVLIRRAPGGGCTIGDVAWSADRARAAEVATPEGSVWTAPISGRAVVDGADVALAGGVQIRDGAEHRLLYGPAALTLGLDALGWSPLDADGAPRLAAGDGALLAYGVDAAALFADGRARAPTRLTRGGTGAGEEDKPEDEADAGEIVGSLTSDRGVRRVVVADAVSDLIVALPRASVALCLQAFRAGADQPAASLFVARGASADLVITGVGADEEITLLAAAAEPTSGARVALRAGLAAPSIRCLPRAEALEAPGAAWVVGAVGSGRMPSSRGDDLFCPIDAADATDLVLVLDELETDVDVELLAQTAPGGPLSPVAASTAGGTAPERLERVLPAGRYFVRLYSFGEPGSRYRLQVEQAEVLAPVEDVFGPSDLDAPHALGALAAGGAPIAIADVLGPSDAETFEIALQRAGMVDVSVTGLSAQVSALLVDAAGRTLGDGASAADGTLALSALAEAGPVRVVLQSFGAAASNYRLQIRLTPIDETDFGLLEQGAVEIARGRVAAGGAPDTASLELDAPGRVRVRLDGMSADADVFLLDSADVLIESGRRGGASVEAFEVDLPAGAYTVRIEAYGSAETDYRLSVERLE